MLKAIPNTLTLCNLICGCLGVVFAFNQQLEWAGYLIGIAAVFDFFDGFAARLLNAKSEIGAQLDSLADMVTFGVLPAIILFQLISISYDEYFVAFSQRPISHVFVQSLSFLVAAFSALRLAKFNVDASQSDSFIGMPTPAIAIFIGSLPLILNALHFNFYTPISGELVEVVSKAQYWSGLDNWMVTTLQSTWVLGSTAVLCAVLLVMPVRMIALKFKGFSWQKNQSIYVFLIIVGCIGLLTARPYLFHVEWLPTLDFLAIPLVILIYPIYSVLAELTSKN